MAIDGQIGVRFNQFWDRLLTPNLSDSNCTKMKVYGVIHIALALISYQFSHPPQLIAANVSAGVSYLTAAYTRKVIFVFSGFVSFFAFKLAQLC